MRSSLLDASHGGELHPFVKGNNRFGGPFPLASRQVYKVKHLTTPGPSSPP